MAEVTNWVKNLGRGKPHACELSSWGMAFKQIGGKPETVGLTFKATNGTWLYVELFPEEVERVATTMKDFTDRRKA
jgi:hypothetical protein